MVSSHIFILPSFSLPPSLSLDTKATARQQSRHCEMQLRCNKNASRMQSKCIHQANSSQSLQPSPLNPHYHSLTNIFIRHVRPSFANPPSSATTSSSSLLLSVRSVSHVSVLFTFGTPCTGRANLLETSWISLVILGLGLVSCQLRP